MSDIGTITEIEPEDGLGWIELPSGDRVRFGGTACKDFVPAVGMTVRVVDTRPGYGGTVKATELQRVRDAPEAPRPSAPKGAAAPEEIAVPRTSLHVVTSARVRADDLLLAVLGRADVDDRLHQDLEAVGFRVQPQPAGSLGCRNPWLYAVAKSAVGHAYGLYAHPLFDNHPAPPWLSWNQEAGTLRFLASDTGALLSGVLASAETAGADAALTARLRSNLNRLGMADDQGSALGEGEAVPWLPPDDDALRSVDDYLAETDGGEMERGLLAHAFGRRDERAAAALRALYTGWGWTLPDWSA